MATTNSNTMIIVDSTSDKQLLRAPLFTAEEAEETVAGAVDCKHNPAVRSETGRWKSAAFIIGVEIAERIAHFGVGGNLINFMTSNLGQSTAVAAANVNAWHGVSLLLTVLGAVIADSFLGKYLTITFASVLYVLGLGLLTLSAMLPSLSCEKSMDDPLECSPNMQPILFFFALYLVGLAQGGHKPCVQAFGADQFDSEDPAESRSKSSFFNWWYIGVWTGGILGIGIMSYVQDNFSWALGFAIPSIIMGIALLIFVLGTLTYRFIEKREGQGPLSRVGKVFVLAARNWHMVHFVPEDKEETLSNIPYSGSQQFRFLDKALLRPEISEVRGVACSMNEVDEAKAILGLFPIWATSLTFAVVFAQIPTFFTKQGVTMDRHIGSSFVVPAASLQSFLGLCVIIFMPIYDCVLVPVARTFTGKPAGISMLQRIGTGFVLSIICMIVSAIIEKKRLETALQHGLVDLPDVTIPMSIWWLLPQYALFGIAEGLTMVGLQEFFYDQVPIGLRSVGLSLYLTIFGIGNLLSSFLVSMFNEATSNIGTGTSWFSNNLNRAHLDYFYLFLAGLNSIGLILFIYFARSYIYSKNKVSM